jgi:hypothetical protein
MGLGTGRRRERARVDNEGAANARRHFEIEHKRAFRAASIRFQV